MSRAKQLFLFCAHSIRTDEVMEALRTQMDNLQWTVNRLETENRMLRAADWEACERVDLELEMKQLRQDASEATKSWRLLRMF